MTADEARALIEKALEKGDHRTAPEGFAVTEFDDVMPTLIQLVQRVAARAARAARAERDWKRTS